MEEKIAKILEASKQVIRDCVIENGAIVAANPTKPYYSREAKHYFYVWPRDAAFTCMTAGLLGITDIQEPFFNWIEERAEDIDDSGHLHERYTDLLYEKYYVNGSQALHRFQPDQSGTLLFAAVDYFKNQPENKDKYRHLLTGLANGLCRHWQGTHFNIVTNDLWEERHTFPDLKDNFTFALAACSAGLSAVNELFPNEKYLRASEEMKNLAVGSAEGMGYFYRSFGIINDENIDASALGLIWPFSIVPPDHKFSEGTVRKIEERIVKDKGVYRYEFDEYDGWMYRGYHRKKGAGYWPLLNFWMVIVLNKMNRRDDALSYYYKAVNDVPETGLIAEQVFNNNIQKAVSPLCWSHTMFILASKELGLI